MEGLFEFPARSDHSPDGSCADRADDGIVTRRYLAFESLLVDLTSRFVNPAFDRVDAEIERGLREVAESLSIDRITLMEFTPDGTVLRRVREYARAGIKSARGVVACEPSAWYTKQLRQGATLVLRRLPDDLPPEAVGVRCFCTEQGLKSHLTIPLQIGETVVATIAFEMLTQFFDWPVELIDRLRLLGKVFADALAHQRVDAALRESEQRFRTVADSCNRDITDRKEIERQVQEAATEWRTTFNSVRDVVTVLDRDMRIVQVNSAAADFMGRPPEQILGEFCHVVMHGTDMPLDECPFAKAMHLRQRAEAELYDPHRDAWLEVAIDPVVDPSGEIVRFVHTAKDITERKRSQLALEQAYQEIRQLKERLERDNVCLRELAQPTALPSGIVGQSPALLRVLNQARQVAKTNSTVLITGETGTGKELVAAAIHEMSPRAGRVMVRVNCAALPATLIESELFGREKGAYTGALTPQMGRFQLADGSTIFLDEVGELPLELQIKLLQVLQEGRFERLGSPRTIQVDVRVIAATNRDLALAARDGYFREDLFYRLNVFPIHVPPLRERPEDIPALTRTFVDAFGKSLGKSIEAIPRSTMHALQGYHWPGNVRELRNVVERAVILCEGSMLHIELPALPSANRKRASRLADVQREHVLEVLELTNWRIRGPGGAAEILDVKPTTLESRMAKLGIQRSGRPSDIS